MRSTEFRPREDGVLIRPQPETVTTEAGLIVDADAANPIHIGTVVTVGPGLPLRGGGVGPMSVRPDDRVAYEPWAGTPIETDDGTMLLLSERDLIGVMVG